MIATLLVQAGLARFIKGACKRLDRNHGQGDPAFFKEIGMLSRYRHENLISLLGFCNESGEVILVYKYASYGSLDRHLTSPDLSWIQRVRICIGAARGLSFLHDPNGTHQRILHRDIKSANILLDQNLNAKVTNFGLSICVLLPFLISKVSWLGPLKEGLVCIILMNNNKAKTSHKCHREQNDIYAVNSLSFHPVHGTFATARSDGAFNFWDKESKQRLKAMLRCNQPITCGSFNNDGSMYAYGGAENHNPATAKTSIYVHLPQEIVGKNVGNQWENIHEKSMGNNCGRSVAKVVGKKCWKSVGNNCGESVAKIVGKKCVKISGKIFVRNQWEITVGNLWQK
ncbi:kinase-like domain, phloem protein 2-like protein [Tanacetum coccineum]